jgi:methylglutaconyl-CoA hydratase
MTAPDASGELVHLGVGAGVATITLDSPANRNALSARLRRELHGRLDEALADDGVRVVVLGHTGRAFCSGMDLTEARGAGSDAQGVHELPALLTKLWDAPKPVVARVAGPARAGGIGLMAACDIAVVAEEATFAFTEVRLGVVPAVLSVTVLPRMAPRAAHTLFLTGETFDGRRAVEVGLADSAVPAAGLDAEVDRFVTALGRGGPRALAATKALLRRDRGAPLDQQFREMSALSARFFAGDEGQEGIAAFAQRRPPSWVRTEPGSEESPR